MAELFAVFLSGFLLATVLWVGVWFFLLKPAQAAQATALEAKEAALMNCVAAKDQCNKVKDKIQAESKENATKLKEALLGWGNCIRGKNASDGQEKAGRNTP